jgi:hypothetical protein
MLRIGGFDAPFEGWVVSDLDGRPICTCVSSRGNAVLRLKESSAFYTETIVLVPRSDLKKETKVACEPAAVTSWLSQAVSDAGPPGS